MRVKFILPALTEATSPLFRPIKYALFPPLGLATLAGFLDPDDEASIEDEHVQRVTLDDEPDLVVIQAYITSASRAYAIADAYRSRGVVFVRPPTEEAYGTVAVFADLYGNLWDLLQLKEPGAAAEDKP